MQAIGLCRFSYPAIGGFQVHHDTLEERIDYLYAPDRLEERFRIFETLTLPCLRHQSDQDFDLIIVIGDSLPKHHRDRLHDLTSGMPQVQIVSRPPGRQRATMQSVLNAARKDPSQPCLQFRYDDDDAVSVDFVERLRAAVEECDGLVRDNLTVAFDYNRGFVAELGPQGVSATDMYRRLYVASLGMYVAGNCKKTIMHYAHSKIDRVMPTVSYTDQPMWVRTHNGYNDSRQKPVKPVPVTPLTPEQEVEFSMRFAIDSDRVRQVFRSA